MDKNKIQKQVNESDKKLKAYETVLNEAEKTFRQLNAENMQATLIQIEDFLDTNHIYAFENWLEGVVWDGPNIKRYWVEIVLKYPYNQMPEPRACKRLLNVGAKIEYELSTERVPSKNKEKENLDPITKKAKEELKQIWLVTLRIPRKFIEGAIDDEDEQAIDPELKNEEVEPGKGDDSLSLDMEGGDDELEL